MSDPSAATHLDPEVREVLRWIDADRVATIDRDLWVGYGRAQEVHARLERILRSDRRQRPDNSLVVGPSNNGKTALAHHFLACHTVPEDPEAECAHIPVVLVQAPNGPRLPPLLTSILRALGREPRRHITTGQLRDEAYRAMQDVKLRLLLLDDLHNVRGSGVGPMLTELCKLGSGTGVSLGCFATREVAYLLRQDEQLANRLDPVMFLPRWKFEDVEYARLLATFERQLPLWWPSNLVEPELAHRVLVMARGTIGGIAGVLRRAAVEAVVTGRECIDQAMLDRVGPPSPDGIDAIERAADL